MLRLFLAWTVYLVFLDAFLVARLSAHSGQALTRLLPVAFLLLPAFFALRFVARLSPSLRAYLFRLLLVRGVRLAACAEALAVGAILVGAFASQSSRPDAAVIAGMAAIAGRVILWRGRRRDLAHA